MLHLQCIELLYCLCCGALREPVDSQRLADLVLLAEGPFTAVSKSQWEINDDTIICQGLSFQHLLPLTSAGLTSLSVGPVITGSEHNQRRQQQLL